MMKSISFLVAFAAFSISVQAQDTPVKATPLLNAPITGVPSHDLLMTRVELPANIVLPMHYHVNEEYLYILEGEAYLRIEGREDRLLTAGEAVVIPAGVLHTAVTANSTAVALTTRVHPKGQPVRFMPNNKSEDKKD